MQMNHENVSWSVTAGFSPSQLLESAFWTKFLHQLCRSWGCTEIRNILFHCKLSFSQLYRYYWSTLPLVLSLCLVRIRDIRHKTMFIEQTTLLSWKSLGDCKKKFLKSLLYNFYALLDSQYINALVQQPHLLLYHIAIPTYDRSVLLTFIITKSMFEF